LTDIDPTGIEQQRALGLPAQVGLLQGVRLLGLRPSTSPIEIESIAEYETQIRAQTLVRRDFG